MLPTDYKQLAQFYRTQLLERVMPFWTSQTEDHEHGGYLTCFDEHGQLTDTTKSMVPRPTALDVFGPL